MAARNWLGRLSTKFHRKKSSKASRGRIRLLPRRWRLESLEDRTTPSAASLDPTFGIGGQVLTNVSGPVRLNPIFALGIQPDGKVVLAGGTDVGLGIQRFTEDGLPDGSFNGGVLGGWMFPAQAVSIQTDGKILVAGDDGSGNHFGVARFNSNGTPDLSFGTDGHAQTTDFGGWSKSLGAMAVDSQGRIVLAGTDSESRIAVARFDATGQLDATFDFDGQMTFGISGYLGSDCRSVAVQSDGRIVIVGAAGYSLYSGLPQDFVLARLTQFGELDETFGDNGVRIETSLPSAGSTTGRAVGVDEQDRIIAIGGPIGQSALLRYNPDGSVDSSFGDIGRADLPFETYNPYELRLDIQSGRIGVVNSSKTFSSSLHQWVSSANVVQFDADGTLLSNALPTLGPDTGWPQYSAMRPDGRVVFAGRHYLTEDFNGPAGDALTQVFPLGLIDSTFGIDGHAAIAPLTGPSRDGAAATIALPNGQLMVLGSITYGDGAPNEFNNTFETSLFRFNSDGSPDLSFGTGGRVANLGLHSTPIALAVQSDGTSVVSAVADGQFVVARYLPDGTPDPNFGVGTSSTRVGVALLDVSVNATYAQSLAVQADGSILLCGDIYDPLLQSRVTLLRLNADGTRDDAFGNNGVVVTDLGGGHVVADSIAIQSDGRIVVAGRDADPFTWADAFNSSIGVARYLSDGSLDPSFGQSGVLISTGYLVAGSEIPDDPPPPPVTVFVRPTGEILLMGTAYPYYGGRFTLVQYAANGGQLDASFGDQGVVTLPNYFTIFGSYRGLLEASGHTSLAISGDWIRLTPDGQLDSTFDGDGVFTQGFQVTAFESLPDGRIFGAGTAADGFSLEIVRLLGTYEVQLPTTASVQAAISNGLPLDQNSGHPTLSLQATTQEFADALVDIFDPNSAGYAPLQPPANSPTPIDIVVDLAAGIEITEGNLVVPEGIRVRINGGIWHGGSPALILLSGNLLMTNATFVNDTDAPTILIAGGQLTLRDCIVQESTGFNQTAISVIGGSLNLGTAADPGGNTININGAGAFALNAASSPITANGTEFTVNGSPSLSPTVHGLVWLDFNNDGEVNFGEQAIANVTINLTGFDDLGHPVNLTTQSDANGIYSFGNLRPSDSAGYTITQSQPAGFTDGQDSLGTVNEVLIGSASINDVFSGIVLGSGSVAENYNFGERPANGSSVSGGQTATIGFWQNKNGQNLIKALNGGATATQLGTWLAATFPNMYVSLDGLTNFQVAAHYKTLFGRNGQSSPGGPPKVDAQVMATALAVYVTNQTLAGTIATGYGFQVTLYGVGARTFNIGNNGAAFGVANGTSLSVMDLLLAVNARSHNGMLYDQNGDGVISPEEAGLRTMANSVFTLINESGGI